jgi:hypothetical protein
MVTCGQNGGTIYALHHDAESRLEKVAGRLDSDNSSGIPAAGYAAELLSRWAVQLRCLKLWWLPDWAQLDSTYTISGLQAGQWVTLGLRLNGSSLSVEIDGVRRITATDSTFTTGEAGLWSYLQQLRCCLGVCQLRWQTPGFG